MGKLRHKIGLQMTDVKASYSVWNLVLTHTEDVRDCQNITGQWQWDGSIYWAFQVM
jgi:hypothetical protein